MAREILHTIAPRDVFQKALDNLNKLITAGQIEVPNVSAQYMEQLEYFMAQQISFAVRKAYGFGFDDGRVELKEQLESEYAKKLIALDRLKKPTNIDL